MKFILGYEKSDGHVMGYMTSYHKFSRLIDFLDELSPYQELNRKYVRLQAKGRLKEFSLALNKLPLDVSKVVYYTREGFWDVMNVKEIRKCQ